MTTNRHTQRDRGPQAGTLIVSVFCLVLGSPVHPTWGQANPNPSPKPRTAKAPARQTTEKKTTSEDGVTPQYSSSDAAYAVTGLLSRTTTRGEEADANLPWSTGLTRRLWESRMAAPDPNEDAETRAALNDLIRRIRMVRFEDSVAEPAFSVPVEPTAPTKPTPLASPAPPPPAPPGTSAAASSTPLDQTGPLTPKTMERLEDMLRNPNQVRDPLELAELLFLSGHRTEAAVFYEQALARTMPSDRSTENDRAWILFQLANCLRETDIARAKDLYMKLVSEHPGSAWTELAKAHGRLITWYQSAKPQQLMPPRHPE